MERLTMTSVQGGVAFTFDLDVTCCKSEMLKILNLATKLKEYEDAEEQGLLCKLPCKVGDTVYRINQGSKEPIIEMHVFKFVYTMIYKNRSVIRIDAINNNDFGESSYLLEDIGKRVFLTKEEAEQALKKIESEG